MLWKCPSGFLHLAISGATNPGVPHLVKRYFSTFQLVAKPKSIRINYLQAWSLKIMFSNFISLWIIYKKERYLSAESNYQAKRDELNSE